MPDIDLLAHDLRFALQKTNERSRLRCMFPRSGQTRQKQAVADFRCWLPEKKSEIARETRHLWHTNSFRRPHSHQHRGTDSLVSSSHNDEDMVHRPCYTQQTQQWHAIRDGNKLLHASSCGSRSSKKKGQNIMRGKAMLLQERLQSLLLLCIPRRCHVPAVEARNRATILSTHVAAI